MSSGDCLKKDIRIDEFDANFIIPSVGFYLLNSLAATICNGMVLWSVWKEASLHTPSKILLCSLSLADLVLGSLSQTLFAMYCISALNRWEDVFCVTWAVNRRIGYCVVSLSSQTLAIMSVDRYLAITTKTSYKTIVTRKRIFLVLLVCWISSTVVVLGAIHLFSMSILSKFAAACLVILLAVIIYTFSGSCIKLRQIANHVVQNANPQPSNPANFDIGKYKTSLMTMVMILCLTVLSYVPLGVVIVGKGFTSIREGRIYFVHGGQMLVFLSSTINPLFYVWRIRDLRDAVKRNVLALKRKIRC